MDLDIKDLDGWEFIYRLKYDHRYYEYKEMPIIIRTDLPVTVETVKKFQSESVYDYIPKSLKGKELLQKIDQYFETIEKLSEVKEDISREIGHVVASEYGRIFLTTRIRLKYLYALKGMVEELKTAGAGSQEIKNIEDLIYLKNRELIKQERRKREIKKRLKEKKKVKEVDRGERDKPGDEAITD